MPDLGEIYPLGGAADRLGLVDPETGECLPAAMLAHCGRTLLEGLIRDLQVHLSLLLMSLLVGLIIFERMEVKILGKNNFCLLLCISNVIYSPFSFLGNC